MAAFPDLWMASLSISCRFWNAWGTRGIITVLQMPRGWAANLQHHLLKPIFRGGLKPLKRMLCCYGSAVWFLTLSLKWMSLILLWILECINIFKKIGYTFKYLTLIEHQWRIDTYVSLSEILYACPDIWYGIILKAEWAVQVGLNDAWCHLLYMKGLLAQ